MRPTLKTTDLDHQALQEARSKLRVGHYFAFATHDTKQERSERFSRLLAKRGSGAKGVQVVPLLDQDVTIQGLTLQPAARDRSPLGIVVADRDLYRAEHDTVNLLIAFPAPPKQQVRLLIEHLGQPLTERDVTLDAQGLALETLAMLLPGSYTARLQLGDTRSKSSASFTVAEYTLAPLSARLVTHTLDRARGRLAFELAVESYQQPFSGKLAVALVEAGREVKHTKIKATRAGHYGGEIKLKGEGPFRLRLSALQDAERVAEVALPGSRASEREITVVSELGCERLFSLLPEPGALAVRGGWLGRGDTIATPLVVDEVVTAERVVRVQRATKQLTAVSLDLLRGTLHVDRFGDVAVDTRVVVPEHGAMSTVFFGGVIDGEPFEGYSTFIKPAAEQLRIELPERARPREDLAIGLRLGDASQGEGAHPYRTAAGESSLLTVLLTVRDQRLTAADPPDVALGASAKRSIDDAVEGMANEGICALEDLPGFAPLAYPMQFSGMYSLAGAMPPPSAAAPGGPVRRSTSRARHEPVDYFVEESSAGVDFEASDLDVRAGAAPPPAQALLREEGATFAGGFAMAKESAALEAPRDTPHEDAAPATDSRAELPEQLFYGLVSLRDGRADVTIPLPDSLATFTVEAFLLADGDWQRVRQSVVVDQPLRVDLELPPAIHAEDVVYGRLRAAAGSDRLRVSLTCDDAPVELLHRGSPITSEQELASPSELTFRARPGRYRARVVDVVSGEQDELDVVVEAPGKHRFLAKELGLMQVGDAITLESADALTLRVLPGLDEKFGLLTRATAGYGHLCCEQTAAKILAAVLMYLTAEKDVDRKLAADIILAGIARERTMLVRGKGFRMYPESDYFSEHYSTLAVRYLWTLRKLAELPGLAAPLARAAREGLELADEAAKAHGMKPVPKAVTSMEDAYALAAHGGEAAAVRTFVTAGVEVEGKEARLRSTSHRVAERAQLAYAAGALVAIGELALGLRLANVVLRQLDEQGMLYSTVDSAAAIALMIELRRAGIAEGASRLRVNGEEMSAMQAQALGDQVESLEVLEGIAAVEVTQLREDDWSSSSAGFKLKVGFRGATDQRVTRLAAADRVDLMLTLPDGYTIGDLAHVQLPAALSRIEGGGKVKTFSIDFAGKDELRIPLVVTGNIEGQQRFAVCVRNMFEEERVASPGLLAILGA